MVQPRHRYLFILVAGNRPFSFAHYKLLDVVLRWHERRWLFQVTLSFRIVEIVTKEMLWRDIVSETPSLDINLLKSAEESLHLFLFLKMVSF